MSVKYVIAYPFGGRPVPCDWHLAVRNLQLPANIVVREVYRRSYVKDGRSTVPLEKAQTEMVVQALEIGAQYIFFIEDDTIPPPGALMELSRVLETSAEDVMTCGGVYTTRSNPPEPIVYMGPGQGAYWKWKLGDIFECWATGMGCTMIKMEAFKRMPPPWFKELNSLEEMRYYPDLFPEALVPLGTGGRKAKVSTDLFFFTKLAKYGMKAMAHGGVLPIHWDIPTNLGYWMPKGTYPTEGIFYDGQEFGWTDAASDSIRRSNA